MYKKIISFFSILLFAGFSFFYAEYVSKIIKDKDPIILKLNEVKNKNYIAAIKPIINNDEYYMGINGCKLDIKKSYNKMKTTKEYKEELIVMKQVNIKNNLKNKYIIGANKIQKRVSIVFIIDDEINNDLVDFLKVKDIKANFFVDLEFLENNTTLIKFISENNNIYYLGNKDKYDDNHMLYANNLIDINTNNKSEFCFLDTKNYDMLKLCSDYNMKTIKSDIINNNLIDNVKQKLSNGAILAIKSNDINKIKVVINYILSKGYNIVTLDKLLNENNNCNK